MMEKVPDSFQDRLKREFDGRYRIRWSPSTRQFHLEQKVEVGLADPPFSVDEGDDSLVRARDGYVLVMALQPSERMPCPRCGHTLPVPIQETAETSCEPCQMKGFDGRWAAAYFPFNDSLIQHLRRIDAFLTYHENLAREADEHNAKLQETATRDGLNELDAISYDVRKTFGGVEQIGYGGSIIRPAGGDI